jgi:hypothetical protein
MTASMTAYSAMSCPWSSDQSVDRRGRDMLFTNLSGIYRGLIVNDPIVPEQMTKVACTSVYLAGSAQSRFRKKLLTATFAKKGREEREEKRTESAGVPGEGFDQLAASRLCERDSHSAMSDASSSRCASSS